MLIRVDRYVFFHRLQLIQIESKVQIPRQLNRALFSVLRPIPNEGKANNMILGLDSLILRR